MREYFSEDIADLAAEVAAEKGLPIILLGGETPLASELLSMGERFLHAASLSYLVRGLYVIATFDMDYLSYEFPRGSVVIDPFDAIPNARGVVVKRLGEISEEAAAE